MSERDTKPGVVLKTYEKAKEKVASLAERGKTGAKDILSSSEQEDPVTSGHDWKGKTPEEVGEADRDRSQEEMDETFGDGKEDGTRAQPKTTATHEDVARGAAKGSAQRDEPHLSQEADLSGDVDRGGKRGEVELAAPDVRADRSVGTDDNPAAPEMDALDEAALAKRSEDEVGRVPSDGMGLDDGPGVGFPEDTRS